MTQSEASVGPPAPALRPLAEQTSGSGMQSGVAEWAAAMVGVRAAADGDPLPPHSSDCAGCGPANEAGIALRASKSASGVRAFHTFDERQVGAPGIAHGGLVATAFDDLFGFVLYTVEALAVTRSITVDYLAPFRLHEEYLFEAHVENQVGRRIQMKAEARDGHGQLVGRANATFVAVGIDHFEPQRVDH